MMLLLCKWTFYFSHPYNSSSEFLIVQVKKSILQGNTESKAMLELIGKTRASEGFRELADEEEEQTEEMKRKMNTIPKLLWLLNTIPIDYCD